MTTEIPKISGKEADSMPNEFDSRGLAVMVSVFLFFMAGLFYVIHIFLEWLQNDTVRDVIYYAFVGFYLLISVSAIKGTVFGKGLPFDSTSNKIKWFVHKVLVTIAFLALFGCFSYYMVEFIHMDIFGYPNMDRSWLSMIITFAFSYFPSITISAWIKKKVV
ncbi:MAG: hypothetical protein ABJH98_11505 [Reichenbachiella sp.]|uniref:hypothetical protein n=1 Tax=Reichenbachiella sp. TaxID=2184521 RepID=UPI0032975457